MTRNGGVRYLSLFADLAGRVDSGGRHGFSRLNSWTLLVWNLDAEWRMGIQRA